MENNSAQFINNGRPVYFSYARNSSKKPEWEHISDCVEPLIKQLEANNIEYRLDKRDISTGDRISDFEREIGWKSEVVVLVFSDKYFRSPHCMFEFVQIKKSLAKYPDKRLMCIKGGDFNLSDPKYIMELEHFWGDYKQEYEEREYHRLREHSGTEKAAFQNGFYLEDIRKLYAFFSTINYANSNNEDWNGFVNDIKKYFAANPEKPKSSVLPPQFVEPAQPKPAAQKVVQNPAPAPKPSVVASPQPTNAPQQIIIHTTAPNSKKSSSKGCLYAILVAVILFLLGLIVIISLPNTSNTTTSYATANPTANTSQTTESPSNQPEPTPSQPEVKSQDINDFLTNEETLDFSENASVDVIKIGRNYKCTLRFIVEKRCVVNLLIGIIDNDGNLVRGFGADGLMYFEEDGDFAISPYEEQYWDYWLSVYEVNQYIKGKTYRIEMALIDSYTEDILARAVSKPIKF